MVAVANSWNRYHEQLLKKWSQISKTYSIMHSLCATYYSNWHKRLGIPVVIIGGVTASSIFSSNKNDSEAWTYINGGLALFVAALSGISSFIGTAEKTNKHQNASFKYTKIAMDIDTMLSFGRHERTQTPQEFIQEKKSAMLDIRENVPEVLTWVMNDYLKKFDKTLTDTKSKVNATIGTYIEPKLGLVYDEENSNSDTRGPSTESSGSSVKQEEIHTGEMLSDFGDKSSTQMFSASEKMKVVSESDSEQEDHEQINHHIINC
jgi:hypothetical protein